jgi:hypothetical protein
MMVISETNLDNKRLTQIKEEIVKEIEITSNKDEYLK